MFANRNHDRTIGPASIAFLLASAVALAVVSGCGYKPPYSCVKVSGKVTYEDGTLIPAQGIRLVFISQAPPVDQRTSPKSGKANVNAKTGEFDSATTFDYKDGLILGKHKVVVQCTSGNNMAKKLVPPECTDAATTPVTVDVTGSPLQIKVPKPH